MTLALISTEFLIAIAMVVLLVAMPLFVIAVLAVVSAYIQYDAEHFLEDLADTDGDRAPDQLEDTE